jgi:hypothetical protein
VDDDFKEAMIARKVKNRNFQEMDDASTPEIYALKKQKRQL